MNVVDRNGDFFSASRGAWLPSVIAECRYSTSARACRLSSWSRGIQINLRQESVRELTLVTIVLKDAAAGYGHATPGDDQDQAMLQVLLNMIDFGMQPGGRGR